MKIKYIAEDDLNAIKGNISNIVKNVLVEQNETLENTLGIHELIKETAIEIEEFKLDMSQPAGKESLTDIENIKRVYNHMKGLSDSVASDERIWAAYTLNVFWDYMKYRWKVNSISVFESRFLFGDSHQRSLFRNGIARLWWIGRVSYDEQRTNPYELTELLCKDQDYIESICGRNVFNNPKIGLTALRTLYDANQKGYVINRDIIRDVAKYVNLLAGTYVIDMFNEEEISNKIYEKLNG